MHRNKPVFAALLAALCLAVALLPGGRLAEAAAIVPEDSVQSVHGNLMTDADDSTESAALVQQIKDAYKAAKKRANRKSFKGKCGAYVNHQLVILGINQKYIGANGNREFDIYSKLETTTAGFQIHAYSAKQYTLQSALEAIAKEDTHARNILVGFEKGTSKAGKKYGHTLFIHGIENGKVYFSDSFAQKVDGKKYAEGAPIVCSIETFCKLYRKYKLDGVIWFTE